MALKIHLTRKDWRYTTVVRFRRSNP